MFILPKLVQGVVGWCDPTILITVGQGPTALAVGAGCFGHFYSHLSFLSSFSLSLEDGPI